MFFDPVDYPFLSMLSANYEVFLDEARTVIGGYRYLNWRYGMFNRRARGYSDGARASYCWRVYGLDLERNRERVPKTSAILDACVPGLVTAGFYMLDAGTHILPHVGVSSDIRRGHMGLVCPPGCWLRIVDEKRTWTNGGFLIFDDTFEHEVKNESDQLRCILLFDFMRPDYPVDGRAAFMQDLRTRLMTPQERPLLAAAGARGDRPIEQCTHTGPLPAPPGVPMEDVIGSYGLYFP